MRELGNRLALHAWTLETTPLPDMLRIARETGWNAVEIRRSDFVKCLNAGMNNSQIIDLVKASGIPVGALGTEYGFLFATGDEQQRLFKVLEQTCTNAVALGCKTIMAATGANSGGVREAAANMRTAGDIVQAHGLRLAYEYSSMHQTINTLAIAREILALADHPACGLVLDIYHLERSGSGGRGFADVPLRDIALVQFSDVPSGPPPAGLRPADRLPPGRGVVRWKEVFGLLAEKGYAGYMSYEAPNPEQWSRPATEVAREAVDATRALLQ